MSLTPKDIPDTFYRVSVKALVYDTNHKLLVFMDKKYEWEIPGGGWEHGETMSACLKRELFEEVRVGVATFGNVQFCYRGKTGNGFPKLSIAVPVTLESFHFEAVGDNIAEAAFVTRDEFLRLPFQASESAVLECVNQIWPAVEK